MKKLTLLAAIGAGYVVGTRAGRERYEQIKSGATKVKDSAPVQAAGRRSAELAKAKAPVVTEKATALAGTAYGKLRGKTTSRTPFRDNLDPAKPAHQQEPPEGPAIS